MEMIWDGSDDLGDDANILTGVMFQGYGPPSGFCFDDGCTDDPIMVNFFYQARCQLVHSVFKFEDDKNLEGYNVDEKVLRFVTEVKNQARFYATNHIMLTMGSDFQYKNADQWFDNLDKLIKYVNDAVKNNLQFQFHSNEFLFSKQTVQK